MNILSIQSHVVFGHVGNAAAVFCMQRLGAEVWPIHTVQFSNHTGYGTWTGQIFEGKDISNIMTGLKDRNILSSCSGIISGYIGASNVGSAIIDAVRDVKKTNPEALYCCDPVMGDVDKGIYVSDGIPQFMKEQALSHADILIPNQFELEYLSGMQCRSIEDTKKAVKKILSSGPKIILITSLEMNETPKNFLDILAADHQNFWIIRTPKLATAPTTGTGDSIASLFFIHYLREKSLPLALEKSVSSVYSLLYRSVELNSQEIQLIRAQNEIIEPSFTFDAILLP